MNNPNDAITYAAELATGKQGWTSHDDQRAFISGNEYDFFEPFHDDCDWVALREALEKLFINLCRNEYGLYVVYVSWPENIGYDNLKAIESLSNKCPRKLAIEICGVLADG